MSNRPPIFSGLQKKILAVLPCDCFISTREIARRIAWEEWRSLSTLRGSLLALRRRGFVRHKHGEGRWMATPPKEAAK